MMNPEVKAKWLVELRSGKYKQGRVYLNQGGNYCCIGVLCEIAEKEGLIVADRTKDRVKYGDIECSLPKTLKSWSGVEGLVDVKSGTCLAVMNDAGVSFNDIADIIEKQL